MVWNWRDKSIVGTPESRSGLVAEFTNTDRLVDLLERTVQVLYPPFTPMVESLLSLIKDKDTLQNELKQATLKIPPEGIWRALDSMYFISEAILTYRAAEDGQSETPRSGLSSINPATKREREDDHDEEMDLASTKEESLHDHSLPASAVDNISEARETSVTLGGDIAVDDPLGIDFTIPVEVDQHVGHEGFVEPTIH